MAIYSRILAWRIPWTEEPGRLQSMGLQRVRHGWATNTHTHTVINSSMKALGRQRFKQGTKTWYEFPWWLSDKESACQCRRLGFNPWVRKIPWRRAWQPTPVFLPGESHGQRSLGVGGLQSIGSQRGGHHWSDLAGTHSPLDYWMNFIIGKIELR